MDARLESPAVHDILEFVKRPGPFPNGNAETAPDGVEVVSDLERAEALAHEEVESHEDWTDLREKQAAKMWGAAYASSDAEALSEDLAKLHDWLVPFIRRRVNGTYARLFDDVVADLHNCVAARAVMGTGHLFFERLFKCYSAGMWPCGWEGNYPTGRMVAFRPR